METREKFNPLSEAAVREKRLVAMTSVFAAVLLTALKLVVGVVTGSLGILSEAAHSGLDLVAAGVTFFAVRLSGKPADREHMYGHGKIENLSALFETLLLLVTCVWIIWEATKRLFFEEIIVDVTIWAIIVMVISIVVDYSRSNALSRVARKYSSQALEADALHFSTDIWSSSVVLAGLGLVWISKQTGILWLQKADAIAALGVAGIVIWISYSLGRKSIADLIDEVTPDLSADLHRKLVIPGVINIDRLRIRRSGPENFVDVNLCVDQDTSLEHGHRIADDAEKAIQTIIPGADVIVHIEPIRISDKDQNESLPSCIRKIANDLSGGAHDIRIRDVMGEQSVDVHLEVSDDLTVENAHSIASDFEKTLRAKCPYLGRIVTHIEPARQTGTIPLSAECQDEEIRRVLLEITRHQPDYCHPHDIRIYRTGDKLELSFHCSVDGNRKITEVHEFTEVVEQTLRIRFPDLGHVVIHVEPPEPMPPPEEKHQPAS